MGAHNHSGRTKSAVECMVFFETILQRMQRASFGRKAFNSGYALSIGLHGKYRTAFNGLTIKENGTGTATACVAANMGACKVDHLTNEVNKQ
jgi:hypothetical protein